MTKATSVLENVEIDEASLVDKGDNPEANIIFAKNKEDAPSDEEKGMFERFKAWLRKEENVSEEDKPTLSEETLVASDDDNKSPQGDTEKSMTVSEDSKNAPRPAEDVSKRLEEIEKRAELAEAEVAKMKADKLKAECVAKAKEFELPGVEVAELAEVFEEVSPETSEKIGKVLSALRAQIDTSKLFGELGSDANGEDSATARLEKIAKEIQTRDGVTFEKAFDQAALANRDLYAASRKEG